MANYDFLALVHLAVGYQLVTVTLVMSNFRVGGAGKEDSDDAVQAMLIIGYVCLLTAFLLSLLVTYASLKGNKAAIISEVVLALAAILFIIVGVIIYGAEVNDPDSYGITTYVTGCACALVASILLILVLCGK